MRDLRWQPGWTGHRDPNLRDLVGPDGLVLGSLSLIGAGSWRGWVLWTPASPRGGPINVRLKADHSDEPSARAWVEAEVARLHGDTGPDHAR